MDSLQGSRVSKQDLFVCAGCLLQSVRCDFCWQVGVWDSILRCLEASSVVVSCAGRKSTQRESDTDRLLNVLTECLN